MLFTVMVISYCAKKKNKHKYTPFGRNVNVFNVTTGHVSIKVWQPGAAWSR
jgi:hypothetical protein